MNRLYSEARLLLENHAKTRVTITDKDVKALGQMNWGI
jgi:hypothetical protein